MRADRLLALLFFLQSHERVTAARVATELEVSIATARRDLEALSAAGVPVYSQPGRGGGWQLLGGARTNLSGLTQPETRALFWLIGNGGLASQVSRVATQKLIRALPPPFRAEAERIAATVHVDSSGWEEPQPHPPAGLEELREALTLRRVLHATYTPRASTASVRCLTPLGLIQKTGIWYLVADEGGGPRTYRADRLTQIRVTGEECEPPQGFDLISYWRARTEIVEKLRTGVRAVLVVHNRIIPILQQQFGSSFTVLSPGSRDTATVEVRGHLITGLAERLAGWGSQITVVSPEALRSELHRIGLELIAQHQPAAEPLGTGS